MKVVIDRIEGEWAMILVRSSDIKFDMPVKILPTGCREGDILDLNILIDNESIKATKQDVASLIEKLKNKNVGQQS